MLPDLLLAAGLVLVLAVGLVTRVPTVRGAELSPLACYAALAAGLASSVLVTSVVLVAGTAAAVAASVWLRRPARQVDVVAAWAGAWVVTALMLLIPVHGWVMSWLAALAGGVCWLLVLADRSAARRTWLLAHAGYTALLASAAVLAATMAADAPLLGPLLGAAAPVLVIRAGRAAALSAATFTQTVTALARVPETAHLVPAGHGAAVARECRILGRRAGLDEAACEDLALAGQLHDVALVSRDHEGGRTSHLPVHEQVALLAASGQVVRQVPELAPVADLLAGDVDRVEVVVLLLANQAVECAEDGAPVPSGGELARLAARHLQPQA